MKHLEKNMATASTSTKPLTKNAGGFTLIELLVVIGIIAILIGLLLPAIQKKREAFAAADATRTVQELGRAANYYRHQLGQYPDNLSQLVQFVTANPSPGIVIDPQDLSGNTYLYDIVENDESHCVIEAEPEFPGITGSLTVRGQIVLENVQISDFQTPGADEAREQMFINIRAKAAQTVVQLLNLDGSATSQVQEYSASPDTVSNVCNLLDADDNGRISIDEIQNHTGIVDYIDEDEISAPFNQFINYVAQEMKWDSLSEANAFSIDIGTSENFESDQPPLFSYDGLSVLTISAISDGTSNTILIAELLDKLEAAEAAEASGNAQGKMKAIKNYQKQVKAQIGQALTRTNAQMLITISKTL